jgi:hypothetical protein
MDEICDLCKQGRHLQEITIKRRNDVLDKTIFWILLNAFKGLSGLKLANVLAVGSEKYTAESESDSGEQ